MADDLINDLQQAVSMGTTIMAASFDGGVVLGADSRTSTGSCERRGLLLLVVVSPRACLLVTVAASVLRLCCMELARSCPSAP